MNREDSILTRMNAAKAKAEGQQAKIDDESKGGFLSRATSFLSSSPSKKAVTPVEEEKKVDLKQPASKVENVSPPETADKTTPICSSLSNCCNSNSDEVDSKASQGDEMDVAPVASEKMDSVIETEVKTDDEGDKSESCCMLSSFCKSKKLESVQPDPAAENAEVAIIDPKEEKEYPSFFGRATSIVPLRELMGLVSDGGWDVKQHWIDSCADNPSRLKSGLTFLFEMEVLMGALFLGLTTSTYFEGIDEYMFSTFGSMEYTSLDFWVVATGSLAVEIQIMFVILAYVNIVTMQPVSMTNFFAWIRTPVCQMQMYVDYLLLVAMLYTTLVFFVLLMLSKAGATRFAIIALLAPVCVLIPVSIFITGYSLNLAQLSGCYGSQNIISSEKMITLTPQEVEKILYERALAGKEELEQVSHLAWYQSAGKEKNIEIESTPSFVPKSSLSRSDKGSVEYK